MSLSSGHAGLPDGAPRLAYQEDERSLPIEQLSIPAVMRELEQQRRPPRVLRALMNSLEARRSARKLGWSRPWNKESLTIFRTHIAGQSSDLGDQRRALELLREPALGLNGDALRFVEQLFAAPLGMAFVFFHNHDDGVQQYEGLTLSFGRRVATDRSRRDRVDILLEDLRVDGAVDGRIDRLRVYVCPFEDYARDELHEVHLVGGAVAELPGAQGLFEHSVRRYHQWKDLPERQWSHWSQRLISYFGPRRFIPLASNFS